MAKGTMTDEISILRFFETGPIERVDLLFLIVGEKMKERLGARRADATDSQQRGSARKRAGAREVAEAAPTV